MKFVLLVGVLLFLTAAEENKLRVFDSKVQRKVYGSKWEEVTGISRKLLNMDFFMFVFLIKYYSTDRGGLACMERKETFAGFCGETWIKYTTRRT